MFIENDITPSLVSIGNSQRRCQEQLTKHFTMASNMRVCLSCIRSHARQQETVAVAMEAPQKQFERHRRRRVVDRHP